MLWHPDPPQGFSKEQSQVIIGRPVIPLFGAPQGIGGVTPPVGNTMLYEDGTTMLYEDGTAMLYEG